MQVEDWKRCLGFGCSARRNELEHDGAQGVFVRMAWETHGSPEDSGLLLINTYIWRRNTRRKAPIWEHGDVITEAGEEVGHV